MSECIKALAIFSILAFSSNAFSIECLHGEEYKAIRSRAHQQARMIHQSYEQCLEAVTQDLYWRAVARCTSEGLGKNIGGGCGHLVSNGAYPSEKPDSAHCEIFKVSKADERKYFNELMERHNANKCEI